MSRPNECDPIDLTKVKLPKFKSMTASPFLEDIVTKLSVEEQRRFTLILNPEDKEARVVTDETRASLRRAWLRRKAKRMLK